jgi:hypothetical protein
MIPPEKPVDGPLPYEIHLLMTTAAGDGDGGIVSLIDGKVFYQ